MDMDTEQKMFCANCRKRWGKLKRRTAAPSDQAKATRDLLNSTQWKNFRLRVLRRDGYACQNHRRIGAEIVDKSNHVDHIVPRDIEPGLVFDLENCETLCANCHNRKTKLEQQGRVIDWSLKVGRFVVYGPREAIAERAIEFLRDGGALHVEYAKSIVTCFRRAREFGARPILVPLSTPKAVGAK